MPPRIRARASGRLLQAERRRRIRRAAAKPGEIVLLDKSRRRRKGTRTRNSIAIDLHVPVQWAVDIDVRKLVHMLRVALASHFSASLLSGVHPGTGAALPKLAPQTKDAPMRTYGVDSGWMARNWLLLPISGTSIRARCRIKPNGRDGRNVMINRALEDGVDFQAVDGIALAVIQQAVSEYLPVMVPASGDGVATPREVVTKGGVLPDFR